MILKIIGRCQKSPQPPFQGLSRVGFSKRRSMANGANGCYHCNSPLKKGDQGGCFLLCKNPVFMRLQPASYQKPTLHSFSRGRYEPLLEQFCCSPLWSECRADFLPLFFAQDFSKSLMLPLEKGVGGIFDGTTYIIFKSVTTIVNHAFFWEKNKKWTTFGQLLATPTS